MLHLTLRKGDYIYVLDAQGLTLARMKYCGIEYSKSGSYARLEIDNHQGTKTWRGKLMAKLKPDGDASCPDD